MGDAKSCEPAWAWCHDPAKAAAIGGFFASEAGPAYISHSELQYGRADALGRWSEDLPARIAGEAARAIAHGRSGAAGGMHCALAEANERILGLAFVRFVTEEAPGFAVLEDLLVGSEARGRGSGPRFIRWIDAECRSRGCRRLFLESGVGNEKAHAFFEARGFQQTSIVMMRDLSVS